MKRMPKAATALEYETHVGVADLLRLNAQPGWTWTHFPAGEHRTGQVGAKLLRMGLNRGWPDFLLISPQGVLHCLEMKRDDGSALTLEQKYFRRSCEDKRVPYAVARSIDEAVACLMRWGALRRAVRIAA